MFIQKFHQKIIRLEQDVFFALKYLELRAQARPFIAGSLWRRSTLVRQQLQQRVQRLTMMLESLYHQNQHFLSTFGVLENTSANADPKLVQMLHQALENYLNFGSSVVADALVIIEKDTMQLAPFAQQLS